MAETPHLHQSETGFLNTVSVYLEKRLIIIFLMGFASGLPLLLSGATLSIWLTEARVSLTTIGLFTLVGTPYTVKYLWAPLIDRLPVPVLSKFLGRRRAWMVVIQLGLMGSIIGLGFSRPESTPLVTAVCAVLVAFFPPARTSSSMPTASISWMKISREPAPQ